MNLQIVYGDLLKQDDVDAIVNTVNCEGVMGKGIALQFKNKWPGNFASYLEACKAGLVRPGKMFVYDTGGLVKPNFIINFPTKDKWRAKSQIEFIREGLVDLVEQIKKLNIRSIAIPPLGCGNGGLDWHVVRPIIENALSSLAEVEIRLFEPVGAPAAKTMEVRTQRPEMTAGRAAVLKVLETYTELGYGLSRIEVQKLAYFLQCAGQPLKLTFEKNIYGPYSEQLRHVLNKIEGHFIRGLGDGVVDAEIEPITEALKEADEYIEKNRLQDLVQRTNKVHRLIEGFQSSYGLELLASVHWAATKTNAGNDLHRIIETIHNWTPRKRALMRPEHIQVARERLIAEGWLS
jgi:O-acetyl-ADP-ribose deacetylase (regulator of RNase III)